MHDNLGYVCVTDVCSCFPLSDRRCVRFRMLIHNLALRPSPALRQPGPPMLLRNSVLRRLGAPPSAFSRVESPSLYPASAASAWLRSAISSLSSTSGSPGTSPPQRGLSQDASMSSKAWDGSGSQEDFMLKDECILVDKDDQLVGHDNKYNCHQFSAETPHGILHRAFSVFLFDSESRLLLQQRASDKITFPNVWTNTCCSHPLYGYSPCEVDQPEDVASGKVPGVKHAAIRKLNHELGIKAEQVPFEGFKFLTRLHYCAPDAVTYGDNAPWGEHELDYILFIKANVDLMPHAEEVRDAKYVTLPELKAMMAPSSGLLWSPWFRIIAENFLEGWWADLDHTLASDEFVDVGTIHRL
mmetsp:Transcript_2145/g.3729  ORF Transcript_2145/g.3729 Transcript_2145/m.3729 type:complete len:356 (-) Transcript_2145:508-1575(-)